MGGGGFDPGTAQPFVFVFLCVCRVLPSMWYIVPSLVYRLEVFGGIEG